MRLGRPFISNATKIVVHKVDFFFEALYFELVVLSS